MVQRSAGDTISAEKDFSSRAGGRLLMRVRDLRKAFGGQVVLDSVSLDLHEGEVVLLQGNNGSGKTTLLNILTGNLEPDSGSIWLDADGTEERFQFPFRWWQELNPFTHFTPEKVATEAVGRTWQDVRLFKTRNLLDNIAVATPEQPGENPFEVLFRNGKTRRFEGINKQECRQLLVKIGLEDREDSSADKISLGQTKRVAIARAIRAGARVLFLDEPLSGLDAAGVEEIMALLTSLAQRERVTLVIVEHVFNIPRILNLAQTVWTLRNGKLQIKPVACTADSNSNGFDGMMQKLLNQFAGPDRQVHEQLLVGGAKLIRIATKTGKQTHDTPILDVDSMVVHRNDRLVVGHRLSEDSIDGLSFKLFQGDVAILSAPNGWGKTSLLEALAGVIPMTRGQMVFRGANAADLPAWTRSQRGLRFVVSRNNLFPGLSVNELLILSRQPRSQTDDLPNRSRFIGELSGGERQRLALNDPFASDAVVLLDEPFLGLDTEATEAVLTRLTDFVNSMSGTLLIALPTGLTQTSKNTQ